MSRLNILLIDHSEEVCHYVKKLLETDDAVKEIHTTTNLVKGLQMLEHVAVDIVILDVTISNHKEPAIRSILNIRVLPIIVLAAPSVDQTAKTVAAMSQGAIDFIKKVDFKDEKKAVQFATNLVMKMQHVNSANRLRSVARKVKETPLQETPDVEKHPVQIVETIPTPNKNKDILVVIGTSTGGPRALHQVIQQIPKEFNHPILIVQHMPAGFTQSLAERLNNIGNIHVKEAEQGEIIQKGMAYVAPGNYHMQVKQYRTDFKIELTTEPSHLPHRPSVDFLFQSVARLQNVHTIAAVLTGMGRDGADGVTAIKQNEKEAIILTESKETSVIDGMPRAVFDTNEVTQILRIEKIGSAIAAYTKKRGT